MKAVFIATLAGVCWGIGEVFTKSVLQTGKVGPVTAIAVRSAIALPFLWLAYWWFTHHLVREPRDWVHADSGTWIKLILGSGLIAGAGGMVCFYTALNLGEISRIKPVAFAVAPATGVILGWLVLGESMTVQKAAAIVLILAGVVLLTGDAAGHS